MSVEKWILEAVEALEPGRGATLREIQRYIDDQHHEELAVHTLGRTLDKLVEEEKLEVTRGQYKRVQKTSREEAIKKLFGED